MNLSETLRKFRDDETGVISIELVLVMPILVWCLLSTFVYFDLYRVESNSIRAALTIADMYSREQDAIDPDYLNGTRALLRTLTFEEANPDYRVTVYRYDEANDRHLIVWSRNRGMRPNLRNADLIRLRDRLPEIADKDQAILLETRTEYDAPFTIGLGPFSSANLDDVTFETFTVIRPRENKLCFRQSNDLLRCGP